MKDNHIGIIFVLSLLLAGCAELQNLRQIKAMQEARISELEKQNNEYKDAYYSLKTQSEKEKIKYQLQINDLKRQITDLKNTQTEREQKLAEDNTALRLQLQSVTSKLNLAKANLKKLKTDYATRIAELQSALEEKDAQQKKAQQNTDALTAQIASLQKKISTLERQISQKNDTISELRKEISDIKARIKKVRTPPDDYKKLKAELQKYKKLIEQKKAQRPPVSDAVLDKAEVKFKKALANQIAAKSARILRTKRGLIIRLFSDDLFEPGSVILTDNAKKLLSRIAELLSNYPDYPVYVEGHTDNTPIKNLPFLDNLALSSARADNVVRFLADSGKVERTRLKSIACSWFHPAATNKTPEGRRENRRVDIILPAR